MPNPIDLIIDPRPRDMGGFQVRRVLPYANRRMVGPFIFFDEMGPAQFEAGTGMDVRPHPHIGLATVTYLFEGEIVHRDSLGVVQAIRPGDVNWMTAGRGIAHSERTPTDRRDGSMRVHGIQSWVALPAEAEETEPSFFHHPKASLPRIAFGDVTVRVIAGTAFGHVSPVKVFSPTLYCDAFFVNEGSLTLGNEHRDRAVYVLVGRVVIDGEAINPNQMAVLKPGDEVTITAVEASRVMLLGGAPMDEPRHIWWNFVSSSQDRIDRAKADWRDQKFGAVPGEKEFIPLPEA